MSEAWYEYKIDYIELLKIGTLVNWNYIKLGYAPVSVISGYGQAPTECETGLNPLLTLLTLGGAAVGFYFVINKLTKGLGLFGGIGRKFQHEQYEKNVLSVFLDDVIDHFWIGMLSWIT